MHSSKTYLGDGVYAERTNNGYIVLTTENGIETTNEIYLEPKVLHALYKWIEDEDKSSLWVHGDKKR